MTTTTLGVKLDDAARERIRHAAAAIDRTPHWLIKQAIFHYLDALERGERPREFAAAGTPAEAAAIEPTHASPPQPFLDLALGVQAQSDLRAAITAAYRRPEPEALAMLLPLARQSADKSDASRALASQLVEALRAKGNGGGPGGIKAGLVQGLLHEFELSSQEGVALMCLAEALLRIPDRATRDALIRDKVGRGDWAAHLGQSASLFVNAATWGLLITGKLVGTQSEAGLSTALSKLIAKSGEPVVRKGVDMAMRLMGEQFVTGETIAQALENARSHEAKGFRYSYDMLGEAALTAADAERYYAAYEQAIHAIGRAAAGRGIYEGPGISVKLSALHPRYSRAQRERVMDELYPQLAALTQLARHYDIGLNIDAEEADRLELSLDLLERLCFEPALAGWNGVGFVIQAYQKRAPHVVDFVVDLARRSRRRLMVRLVKGAYWDSEIKRAQVDGLEGYPVWTRKLHTDVAYLACARKLLDAPEAIYPQFATHNAYTVAAIYNMAGLNYYAGQYEFQCLHGMGEPLYDEVVGAQRLGRPCRVYAPVGSHETLLPYLVRRLLENGANSSFVNKIGNLNVPIAELVGDPALEAAAQAVIGAPHPAIPLPRALFGTERINSSGLDLSNEHRLASVSAGLLAAQQHHWIAAPVLADGLRQGVSAPIVNPADTREQVGKVIEATPQTVHDALAHAFKAQPVWQSTPAAERAAVLERAADRFEAERHALYALAIREAGKSLPNAVGEVREAVDFLRYYAAQIRTQAPGSPIGPVVCISPWNFPLAIFSGQIAAALAAGNVVIAKPAEQTPLIAALATRLLIESGLPPGALQLLPGRGETVGAALVADALVHGVMFTGSTEVARLIARQLAGRLLPDGSPLPLVAETGGQNAMIVDSSALLEQVVNDAIASAFDSAGQRCSALRVLCLQDEIADRAIEMLQGAMAELHIGQPDRLVTDVGPVIDAAARDGIEAHISAMRARGLRVHQTPLPEACRHGHFVAPTLIEIDTLAQLGREVFGPVLHVLRYRREALPALLEAIHAGGYGLTMGLHTRIDETIGYVTTHAKVGNLYVNRNVIGAVVGVQPFGGEGLSGTGPKAGGPLSLSRLTLGGAQCLPAASPAQTGQQARGALTPLEAHCARLHAAARDHLGLLARWCAEGSADQAIALGLGIDPPAGRLQALPGPTGEANLYALLPRGSVLCIADAAHALLPQLAACIATGNRAVLEDRDDLRARFASLPPAVAERIEWSANFASAPADAALFAGHADRLRECQRKLAQREGALLTCTVGDGSGHYPLERLLAERVVSLNISAAGGNASLMMIG
ncbi:trifunctional transcriptional regulator/proline dehydrogenase/L-glutamate gamma-semialdehyde dehydrogenase [Niveibacterium sp. 24ML]|uniref:trifunctional transcriptional regulator/proline dehydrogenase/L-glutamate gamma-semialdehyde dehydrogenase n=1 Tax=Niveibacterium sp. 24ML TaxID=2985512 RepID=UPI00227010E1|nr:trifunctional transcriptional regulator/proline dehydrogenase/L-glutamate gamma-semialdehyde dehydrogenase [Niveibacterium sp. 24ML]MCX9155813.1 trifunctional transcriptional regulator/proline dehydrogenase/L-glutamate gamma-semialdehyde dehydrogenase [Niveibacterium sp. 24ML]